MNMVAVHLVVKNFRPLVATCVFFKSGLKLTYAKQRLSSAQFFYIYWMPNIPCISLQNTKCTGIFSFFLFFPLFPFMAASTKYLPFQQPNLVSVYVVLELQKLTFKRPCLGDITSNYLLNSNDKQIRQSSDLVEKEKSGKLLNGR